MANGANGKSAPGCSSSKSSSRQSSRLSFCLSALLRVRRKLSRRKLSRARVIKFVRSALSRTASGHARSSALDNRSCRKRQRRWISRRRAPLWHLIRRIGRALPLPPTSCLLLRRWGSREAERYRKHSRGDTRHGGDRRQCGRTKFDLHLQLCPRWPSDSDPTTGHALSGALPLARVR